MITKDLIQTDKYFRPCTYNNEFKEVKLKNKDFLMFYLNFSI